jgi:hypothetical protein
MFQLNWMEIAEEIDDLFLGDAEVCLNCVTKLIHTNINIIKLNIIFYYFKKIGNYKIFFSCSTRNKWLWNPKIS